MSKLLKALKKLEHDQQLHILENATAMVAEIDNRIELAQQQNHIMNDVIPSLLGILLKHMPAEVTFLVAQDEELQVKTWTVSRGDCDLPSSVKKLLDDYTVESLNEEIPDLPGCIVWPLDVCNNVQIGLAGAYFVNEIDPSSLDEYGYLVDCFCEEVDNYVMNENMSRKKHLVELSIGQALKHRVFSQSLLQAISILKDNIDFNTLIIFYYEENDRSLKSLKYLIYTEEHGIYDPYKYYDRELHRYIMDNRESLVSGRNKEFFKRFSITTYQEEFLMTGVVHREKIGTVIVASETSLFDYYELEILDIFVSFIQQRLVDFNKDWRRLSNYFSVLQRIKLLEKDDYLQSDLSPRLAPVAIIYADISSFTFFSEQILREPQIITQLIDIWAEGAISLIWKNDGCFDKLVGDCAIGYFGPPFYTDSPVQNCYRALKCADDIRKFTAGLLNRDEKCFDMIRKSGKQDLFGVATGVNYGEVNIGLIGPNHDFTSFGSCMNNTARIQGKAEKNEILLLKTVYDLVQDYCRMDGPYLATLKNVLGQVEYYRLLDFLKEPEGIV